MRVHSSRFISREKFLFPFHFIKTRVSMAWKNFGLINVLASRDGTLFFRFENTKGCEAVLKQGPCIFAKQAILLKKWN